MLRNMVTSLFNHERIETTAEKAKEARRVAERMITFARRGDLSARRHVAKTVQNPTVLRKLFDELAPRYVDRPGGYTRILKTGARKGDAARTAILELIPRDDPGRKKKKQPRRPVRKIDIPESPVIAAKKKAEAEAKAAEKKAKEEAAAAEADAKAQAESAEKPKDAPAESDTKDDAK
jgi:large subunit ribosomal protein L17